MSIVQRQISTSDDIAPVISKAVDNETIDSSVKTVRPSLKTRTRLLLLPFRSGEAVTEHPDLSPMIKDGWRIQSASPRVTKDGTRLFVVLKQSDSPR